MRGATLYFDCLGTYIKFQSTLLMRGATASLNFTYGASEFQSTLLMRGATSQDLKKPDHCGYFNPRSSCEERQKERHDAIEHVKFQSTLLMRGATRADSATSTAHQYFNPRSSCEERPARQDLYDYVTNFNPRNEFQSTLLMRGATVLLSSIDLLDFIIHFSRTTHLFPKTLLLALCPVNPIFCVMALRA